jgi:hypothetical protein
MKYGYARESTDGQSVDAQVRQLTKAGYKKVFREVASGAKTDRAQLRKLLAQLEEGDVLTVTRLDRLARSTRDLLNTLATMTAKGAGFRSLNDAWADLDAHSTGGPRTYVQLSSCWITPSSRAPCSSVCLTRQSAANQSLVLNSLLAGNLQGIFPNLNQIGRKVYG